MFQMVADCASFAEASRQLRHPAVATTDAVAALRERIKCSAFASDPAIGPIDAQGDRLSLSNAASVRRVDDAARAVREDDNSPRGQCNTCEFMPCRSWQIC